MPTFNGTSGNDSLIGTDGDDLFNSSTGSDVMIGGAGYDRAVIDYSAPGNASYGQSIYNLNGLYARFYSADGSSSVELYEIEDIEIRTGSGDTVFNIDLTQVAPGWRIAVDGGGGFDSVSLSLHFESAPFVATMTDGVLALSLIHI